MLRLRALLRNITKQVKDINGNAMLWGVFLVLAIVILFLPFFEKWRLHILIDEASKKVTTALTSLADSHLYDSYSPVRDGTSGAFVFDGVDFAEIKDVTGFQQIFIQLHKGSLLRGEVLQREQGSGQLIYEISNIRIFIHNAVRGELRSVYRIEYTLSIPQEFMWRNNIIVLDRQTQKVQYLNKY